MNCQNSECLKNHREQVDTQTNKQKRITKDSTAQYSKQDIIIVENSKSRLQTGKNVIVVSYTIVILEL